MVRRSVVAAAVMLLSVATNLGWAAEPNLQKYAVIDEYNVDVDFYFQGEYYGEVPNNAYGNVWAPVGLQVIALGDGQFAAVEYPGGLPGSGYDGGLKYHLRGRRQGRGVFLTGEGHNFVLVNGYALIYYRNWHPLGQINKVKRVSPTLGAYAPPGALKLFNGSSTRNFVDARMTWDGLLKEGTRLRDTFEDYRLHVEFQLPYMPYAREQGRSNSGIYLQGRYEVQILDSFGLEGADNECGGLYRYRRPDINMCFPPLCWQTYDIDFRSPRFDEAGNKMSDAVISVWHNGVLIHGGVGVSRKTGGGAEEGPIPLPIEFQDHGNPVRFRNIWLVDYRLSPVPPAGLIAHGTSLGWSQQGYLPLDEPQPTHHGGYRYGRAYWLY